MKNTKKCTKCNSENIVRIPGSNAIGVGNSIMVGRTVGSAVNVTRYLCCECGFLEEWIDSREDIESIIKKYR